MDPDFAKTLAIVISSILNVIQLIVIASIVVSWVGDRSNQIVQTIQAIAEPIYKPLRPLARKIPGPLDWTPIMVFLIIIVIDNMVVAKLMRYGVGAIGDIKGP